MAGPELPKLKTWVRFPSPAPWFRKCLIYLRFLWRDAPSRKSATKVGYDVNGAQYLYRRPSGVYFVRLCVPARLKQAVGKGEIHRSTGCRDYRLAKIVAVEIAGHWHRAIEAVQGMDPQKIKAGSLSLLGSGFVGLLKAASELGAEPPDLAQRLADRGARFFVEAAGWLGWALTSIEDDADYEVDEFHARVMVLPPRDGTLARFDGRLRIRHAEEAVKAAEGEAQICQFLVWPSQSRGFVVDLSGQLGIAAQLQVAREDVEALDERFGIVVVLRDVQLDGPLEFGHARKGVAANSLFGDVAKEPFHHVQPGRARWREVHDEARVAGQPLLHFGVSRGARVAASGPRRACPNTGLEATAPSAHPGQPTWRPA